MNRIRVVIQIIVIFSLSFQSLAQENQAVDSLLNRIQLEENDTLKIELFRDLSIIYGFDTENAVQYAKEGLHLAEKIGYKEGIAASFNGIGNAFYLGKDYNRAIDNLDKARKIFENINHKRGVVNCLLNLGNCWMMQGDYAIAIEAFNESISIAQEIDYKIGISKCYRNLGIIEVNQSNYSKSIHFFEQALLIEKELGDKNGISVCLNNIGVVYNYQGNHLKSLEYQEKALEIAREIGNKNSIAARLINLGVSYDDLGNFERALFFYNEALVMKKEVGDKVGLSICYNNIGEVYNSMGDYAEAINYYEKSLSIDTELDKQDDMAICLLNIGNVHFKQNDPDKALEYYKKSLAKAEAIDEKRIMANVLNCIGELYVSEKGYDKAVINLERASSYCDEIGDESEKAKSVYYTGEVFLAKGKYNAALGKFKEALILHEQLGEQAKIANDNIKISLAYYEMDKTTEALKHAVNGFEIGNDIGSKEIIRAGSELLSKIYASQNNFEKAYRSMLIFKEAHDSIFTLENTKQINLVEHRFELERNQNEIKLQQIRLEKQDAEIVQQEIRQNALLGSVLAAFVIIILIVIGYLRIQKSNKLIRIQNDQIEESNEELNQANEELHVTVETVNKQKAHIEKTNKEITASIYYAQYIQKAILPKIEDLKNLLHDYFVLYKPKDIVSGDFYWTTHIEGKTIIVAADCTGHGVPGAFMSMLGVSFLNDIINKEYITHPGVVLRRLRKEVIHALQQTGKLGEQRDGMDISLCTIDFKTMELQFSGANSPLYIIRHKDKEPIVGAIPVAYADHVLYEIKGDRMPIALYEIMDRFKMVELTLKKGDQLYMFSDGYVDQFGGKHGKRLKSKPFKELLLANCTKPLDGQKKILDSAFYDWKQENQQIDDIMVMGILI